jgi:hypothetical protein
MAREVYTDKEFIQFSSKHVLVRIMEDTDAEGERIARRFRIEGTPTLVVLNSSGKEVGRILGGRDVLDLIDSLEEIMDSAHPGKYTI